MSKVTKDIVTGVDFYGHIAQGVEQVYEVAKSAYGPGAGNVIIELPYGDPIISRDGVTNVERVYLPDPVENAAARLIVQASKKSNKKVGDGTTAVVILARCLYVEANKLIATGLNRMEVSRMLKRMVPDIITQINKMKIDVTPELLQHVAVVAAGDEATGQMIADVISVVGLDGGVTVEDFAGVGIYNELVDGFYWRKGFTSVNLVNDPSNLESRHENIDLLISEKRLNTTGDVAPILDKIVAQSGLGKELVLVGDVSEEVLGVLFLNRLKGIISVTVVDIPDFGAMRSLTLEDLALVTGGKVYLHGSNASDFELDWLGGAKKVIANEFSTTVIGGEGASEDIEKRIKDLRQQLHEAESPVTAEALKSRLSKLTGKVAIVRVGGATEVEQGEVKLRVQDSICAVQAAIKDGIVPGGGVALARVHSPHFEDAFKQPFLTLVENCGYNPDRALWRLQESKASRWYGYDLKDPHFDYTPINTLKAGVVDPASVVKETVQNAVSVVAELITGQMGLMLANREEKHD
jgi:chaperonin GroEL